MQADGLPLLARLDLSGRAFRAREGRTHVRGWVVNTSFDGTYARVKVRDVLRKRAQDTEWSTVDDFSAYEGHCDITSVWLEPDDSVNISITYIGQVTILPAGIAP
ncbi:MAG: hypothetical protein ABL871_09230 [Terricaulis sp.]